jgi:AraC family cel operon transcriptional repressor
MILPVLKASELIDPSTEIHYAFHKSLKNITAPHSHDFFELFIVLKGSVIHKINGSEEIIKEGSLVFIRPQDNHFYEKYDNEPCELINLAFPQRAVDELMNYLGEGFSPQRLLKSANPPFALLSNTEKKKVAERLEELHLLPRKNKALIKTKLRILLLELFVRYFPLENSLTKKTPSLPDWLSDLLDKMQKKENFSSGLNSMLILSGKTQEHLCRIFRKYLNITPTAFINELRLNYAANMLTNSDAQIFDISSEAGFENLSHFYHLFKQQYKMSPRNFRKVHHRNMIPS